MTWVHKHRARTLQSESKAVAAQFRLIVRDQRRLMKAGRGWIRKARLRLRPPPPHYSVGHAALWECIHSREAAWNADTGNGYHGGLQLTYGWAGRVGNAALMSPGAQMAAAEAEYAKSGYSTSWLLSQWPNTAPPCLG